MHFDEQLLALDGTKRRISACGCGREIAIVLVFAFASHQDTHEFDYVFWRRHVVRVCHCD